MPATPQLSTNLGLDQLPVTDDQKEFDQLFRIYNAIKAVASNLDTYTGAMQYDSSLWSVLTPALTLWTSGANRLYLPTSDILVAGDMVSIWNNAGVMTARKAGGPAWIGGDCKGYSTGIAAAGARCEIILFGLCPYVTGLTPGATHWVSNGLTGAFTAVKPAVNGNKIQPIGFALTSTTLFFNPSVLVPTLDTASLAIPVLTP